MCGFFDNSDLRYMVWIFEHSRLTINIFLFQNHNHTKNLSKELQIRRGMDQDSVIYDWTMIMNFPLWHTRVIKEVYVPGRCKSLNWDKMKWKYFILLTFFFYLHGDTLCIVFWKSVMNLMKIITTNICIFTS